MICQSSNRTTPNWQAELDRLFAVSKSITAICVAIREASLFPWAFPIDVDHADLVIGKSSHHEQQVA